MDQIQGQTRDNDFVDIQLNKDGKVLPTNWKWDSSTIGSMKKILIAMTPLSYSTKDRDNIRVMDDSSVLVSFIRKFPELSRPFLPSTLRDVERALQLNWQTFEQQFISILGKIESERLLKEINDNEDDEDAAGDSMEDPVIQDPVISQAPAMPQQDAPQVDPAQAPVQEPVQDPAQVDPAQIS